MRNIAILTVLTAALAATVAYATDGDSPKGNDAKAAAPAAAPPGPPPASVGELKDLHWFPASPDKTPTMAAFLWGDPKSGPLALLLKVPNGNKAGEHIHSGDYVGVVISGQPSHGDDEKSAKAHAAGYSWSEKGKHPHWDGCITGKDDCLIEVVFPNGGFDFTPVGPDGKPLPPPPAKK